MLSWLLWNTVLASALALLVSVICRLNAARPALCHWLWLLVFGALVAPPLPLGFAPGSHLRDGLATLAGLERLADTTPPSAPTWEEPSLGPGVELSVGASLRPRPERPAVAELAPSIAAAPTRNPLTALSLRTWLLIGWAAGTLFLLAREGRRMRAFQRRVASAAVAKPGLLRSVGEVAARFGIAPPPVSLMSGVGSPSVWCLGRAQLLWPADDPNADTGDRALIGHELAHIARRDHWVARGEALAKLLLWWHPLFWIVRRQVHDHSELACDAWAVWACSGDRRAYAEALIDAQERSAHASLSLEGLCATGRDVKDFERRLHMIMSRNVSRRVSKGAAAVAFGAMLMVLPGFSDEASAKKVRVLDVAEASPAVSGLVDARLLHDRAEKLFHEKRYEQARVVYDEVLKLDPEHAQTHSRLAYILIGAGESRAALKHLERQSALGFNVAVASYNIACAKALLGETQEACAALDTAVRQGFPYPELMAEDADLDALRGQAGFAELVDASRRSLALRKELATSKLANDPAKTLEAHRALGDIVTLDGKLQHDLGLLLLKNSERRAAETAFARQAAAHHLPANAQYNIACARALRGDLEGAFSALSRAAEMGMNYAAIVDDDDLVSLHADPRFEALAAKIAAPNALQEKFAGALERQDFTLASKLVAKMGADQEFSPKLRAWSAFALGEALVEAGRSSEAIAQFDVALERGYAPELAVFGMARAHAFAEEPNAALRDLDDALTLGFDDAEALAALFAAQPVGSERERAELLGRAKDAAEARSYDEEYQRAQARGQSASSQMTVWEKARNWLRGEDA